MAFNAYNQDEQLQERSKFQTMIRLFKYLLDYKGVIVVVFLMIAINSGVSIINPLLMQKTIDEYIIVKDMDGLVKIILLSIGLNLLSIIAMKVRMLLMANISNNVIAKIRLQLYCHLQSLDLSFFDSRPSGKILARVIGDVNSLKGIMENAITTLIPEFVTIICVTVIMFSINVKLALAALCSLPLLIIGIFTITLRSEKHWRALRKKESNQGAFINESMSGMKVIQGFSAEKETARTMKTLVTELRGEFMKAVFWVDAYGSLMTICRYLAVFGLFFGGVKILGIENVSVGTYLAFTYYIGMFWQPLQNLSDFINQFVNSASGAERIFEIMDTETNIKEIKDAKTMPPIKGNVEFSNVCFSYNSGTEVLHNVEFSVKQGETIALIGPTGAGKSTIINLLSRFYDVDSGSVLIDGINIKDVTIESLRTQMGIMTQDNYIFSGTIKDNIRYGKLDATDEEIIQAAKAVHADDFISTFEDGYDMKLTSRGGELSNGQRQLIAFARTMISNPKILILDEATSNIDTKTELLVQKGIQSLLKNRTSFVIAHRLSTIQNSDRIYVIDDGGIIEQGSPKELFESKGAYYNLYMAAYA